MTAVYLVAVVLLVFINGFFVAAEFALVRVRRARIEAMAKDDAAARMVLEELDEINEYLSACQVGITLASIGIGFLGEPAIAELIEPLFGGLSSGVSLALSVFIAYVVVTILHITVGEQVPKVMAITRAEAMARRVARPLRAFSLALRPFIVLLNKLSTGMARLLGYKPEEISETVTGAEDLKLLIGESLRGGQLETSEAGMLSGVFHLHEQQVRQVMTPIPAVVTVDASDDVQTALRRCIDSGHTRLVVTEQENRDRILGLAHANSLAKLLMAEGASAPIESIVYDAPIVPETKPLDDLLAELQRARSTLAVVVDEYGRTEGIVTIEDIVEEVVGEIDDETDPASSGVRHLADGDWLVRGHVAINDLVDHGLALSVDSEDYNSIGGFVFGELGRLPKRGDLVEVDDYRIRVENVRANRVEAVRISPPAAPR